MKKGSQRAMHCRCGRQRVLANGMCATCYTLRRQDEAHFGGLREKVLDRDGHCCRVCGASGRAKRSIIVHHRVPGRSILKLMIALCPACHARIHKTRVVLSEMPPLLLELWREQYPFGHEQTRLDFRVPSSAAKAVQLFAEAAQRTDR
jgi:5-methylcytosine-specific restriction endonuclease McrA